MSRRRRNRSNDTIKKSKKNVIRCKKLLQPVFEDDKCDDFKSGLNKETEKNCKNCVYSF